MHEADDNLVKRAELGDRGAFALLYDRRAPLIRALCWDVTRDHHAAAELTQEVFLRAFRHLGRLREPGRFSSWLLGIARRVCREWERGRGRDRRGAPLARGAAAGGVDGEMQETVRRAVAGLPEAQRAAVHAYYLCGMSADAAAEAIGVSRSGLYALLASARAGLKRELSNEEVLP